MKKLILSMGVIALTVLASCGGSKGGDSESAKAGNPATEATAAADQLTIPSTDAKILGEQAPYVKIDATKPATIKIGKDDETVVKVPLILEKTLKYGENTGLGFTLKLTLLDANGDEIEMPKTIMVDLGTQSLDTGVFDELKAFMQSEPGATFDMPFLFHALNNPEAQKQAADLIKTAKSYKVTGFTFVHLPENAE